ncbi:hypothetical protein B0T14DRAFT_496722 [Immersiella caudata]|uniref:Uncharacterized protein n=1 Tax=Immersiella caudata TaxID=314043 RepID=A0AA39WR89_9PEZI|nr:hypothetical protein B0T14DRAFT_496722 [Immersiella caudata]
MYFSSAALTSALLWAALDVQARWESRHALISPGPSSFAADMSQDHQCGNTGRPLCYGRAVQTITASLRARSEMCVAEPGQCKRMACSKNCGLWLCNEKKERIEIPCRELGDHSQWLFDTCKVNPTLPRKPYVSGWIEDERGYKIDIGKAKGKDEMCTF